MTSLVRKIAFSQIRGINITTARQLIERVGDIDAFFDMSQNDLWQAIGAQKDYCSTSERSRLLAAAEAEAAFIENNHAKAHFFDEPDYPQRLLQCEDAPAMLYSIGDCNFNASHVISVVGTRNATNYGLQFTEHLIGDLKESLEDVLIISGLAYGIDVAAHRASLHNSIPTAGVVAHGLRTIYPAEHRNVAASMIANHGAIVTEYVSTATVHRGNFLARNRIIAGMCDALVVAESDSRGGALVTAKLADAYNHEVFALPGRITDRYSRGCNALIVNRSAIPLRSADDLISQMQWQPIAKEGSQGTLNFRQISPEMQLIIDHLRQNPDDKAAEIAAALNEPFATIRARLMEMELDDFICIRPGGFYDVLI
jgi:DNA processing protein